MLTLEPASEVPPAGLASLLLELGDGEAGFGGTPFGRGEATLAEYLETLLSNEDPDRIKEGRVPETVFWALDGGRAVGILRMRHYLNAALRVEGGHIGYYIRQSARGRGFATEALRLGLKMLAATGVRKALLTTAPDNVGSIRVIEANGGSLEAQVTAPDGAGLISQYWIELV